MSGERLKRLLAGEDIDVLEHDLAETKLQKEHTEKTLQRLTNEMDIIQQELDRRELDRFWAANPTLTPVKVGDFITITPEWWDERVAVKYQIGDATPITRIAIVKGGNPIYFWIDGTYGIWQLDYEDMIQMRKAWLAQQGETT